MKRSVAIGLFSTWISLSSQAFATEGSVAALSAPQIEQDRRSSYVGGRSDAQDSGKQSGSVGRKISPTSRQHVHVKGRAIAGKVARAASQALSPRASYFYIFDAGSAFIADRDDDGYSSEFRIRFDADTDFNGAWVYAKLYLRRIGEVDWQLYHVTDDFFIEGHSDDDDYYVTTSLDDGFPTGEYDVLIDLYESDRDGIVATLEPFDSPSLSLLPLEEVGLDVPIGVPGYSIEGVSTTLLIDDDGDDHFSKFRITFDPDADFTGAVAYVRVWIRARGGEWIEEFVSEDFVVDTSGSADAYEVIVDWLSGYPTSFYDVQIDMYDASTSLLAASAGSERLQLAQIPLEDAARDLAVNPPVTGGGGSASSSERGGGGALTLWWTLGLAALAWIRIGRARAHCRAAPASVDTASSNPSGFETAARLHLLQAHRAGR